MDTDRIYAFAREEVYSSLFRRYEKGEFSRDLWKRMGEVGLFGYLISPEHGGSGKGPGDLVDAVEAFIFGGHDLGLCLSWLDHLLIHALVIARFGTDEQKERTLPALALGDRIGALAASEPGSGANPVKMRTRADKRNGTYLITGRKTFITNGPEADRIIVLARTGPSPGKEGISAFLVEAPVSGFRCESRLELGFLQTSPHGELVFEDCPVPAANLIDGLGAGHVRISRAVFVWERFLLASAMAAHFRLLLDRVLQGTAKASIALADDVRREVALLHVQIEGLREVAKGAACEVLGRSSLDRRLTERLLFLGSFLHQWWERFERFFQKARIEKDPSLSILLQDARLLHVGRRLQDLQFGRIAEDLLAREGPGPSDLSGREA